MKTKTRSIEQLVEEQVRRWQILSKEEKKEETGITVITVSREPGSGGNILAKRLSENLEYDLFYQEVIHQMAESARVSIQFVETLDEKGVSVLEDWISSLVDKRHLWPDQYLQHLMKIIGTIGKHGKAVIVGRGANFILPPEKRLSVRLIGPLEKRVRNVSHEFGISSEEARRRVIKTDSNRRAFIRKYFNDDIRDPLNYDLVLNSGRLNIDDAVNAITGTLNQMSQRPPV